MSQRDEPTTDQEFERIARAALDDALERHPEEATYLGDHRYDDRLSQAGAGAREDERRAASGFLEQLGALDMDRLSPTNAIDADLLADSLRHRLFELERLRPHEWDPLVGNPADAIYPLLARAFAPAEDRLRSVARRLAGVPSFLEAVRADLGSMPRVHVETAIAQFRGTIELSTTEVDRVLEAAPALRGEIDAVRPAALEALGAHVGWLQDRLEDSNRDPRIGPELFAPKLAHALDAATDSDAILARAEADLERVEQEIAEVAGRLAGEDPSTPGLVRRVLDEQAGDRLDDTTVVDAAKQAFEEARAFVEAEGMVSLIDDPVEIIVMPEFQCGVGIAYCDPPGPWRPPRCRRSSRSHRRPRTGRRSGSSRSTASTTRT
jgi:hypothetical protein